MTENSHIHGAAQKRRSNKCYCARMEKNGRKRQSVPIWVLSQISLIVTRAHEAKNSWRYDTKEDAETIVDGYCALAHESVERPDKVAKLCIDDHHSQNVTSKQMGLVGVCAHFVSKWLYVG